MCQITPHAALPAAAGLVAGAAVLLAGCGGAGAAGSSAAAPAAGAHAARGAAGAPAAAQAGGAPAAGSGAGQPASPAGAARLAPAGQNIVYTAAMSVRVRNVSRAAASAAAIAGGAGGYVSQETVSQETASQENRALRPGAPGGGAASIQLKVPVAAYPAALRALAGLGTQMSLRQQAQDVTQQVADTASRVSSDRAVISQLRGLLSRAGSVSNLLAVQDQISAQESALEAMQARQRALDHQTAYATVSLQLQGPVVAAHAGTHATKARSGFVSGLTAGWKALVTLISWLLSALGAILPIGAVLALAGYLGYRGLRGRRWLQRRGARP
jgi:hypothetical protein